MAILEWKAFSAALRGKYSATTIFPDRLAADGRRYPALYFLHDIGGDDTDIRTVKNLEALANELGLFLICPNTMHSYGMDLQCGGAYGTFFCRELPGFCGRLFPLDEGRRFVGGWRGGAYGAYWHAANHPEHFQGCVLINGHYDVAALCDAAVTGRPISDTLTAADLQAAFGELKAVRGSKYDILRSENPVPQNVFMGCDEDSPGISVSAGFAKQLKIPLYLGKGEEDLFDAGLRWLCRAEQTDAGENGRG